MKKRQKEIEEKYEAQWDGGRGSHHPDYDPEAVRLCSGGSRSRGIPMGLSIALDKVHADLDSTCTALQSFQ